MLLMLSLAPTQLQTPQPAAATEDAAASYCCRWGSHRPGSGNDMPIEAAMMQTPNSIATEDALLDISFSLADRWHSAPSSAVQAPMEISVPTTTPAT
jgi:hypothetical protein